MRTSFSKLSTVVTNIGEHRVSGTVSVKNISRTNIEKPNEIKSMQMKPLNNGNRNGNTSANPRSAVNFVRVNRVSNMDDTDTTNLNTIRQKNSISTISKKMTQFNVTTLP
jgi:UDP-N-acetylmuramyl pentapeptide synthase